ncbi:MAG: ABC transporter substrate-binding protein [Alphaproteobacteria bacterium]|nr:ABC transporter substrate-binding protein [Alphaproteobacteria bacterium]MBV8337895.1 ABC transporter substrate-binding protein [Alphaproteobacteria bacterium]
MSLQARAARAALLFVIALWAVPLQAADFVDSAERYNAIPDRIGRVMPADQSAAALIYVLAPEKLVGWSRPLSRAQQAFIPAKFARLPVVGQLAGSAPTAAPDTVIRVHPDLIIYTGSVSPEVAAQADAIQQQTRTPYLVLDGSIQQIPDTLATVGAMLGVGERGQSLATEARTAIGGLRGRLLITESTDRPLVYYGLGPNGLETGLAGSQVMATIDQAGVINVAARLGAGELTSVTREQIFQWNPAIVIAQRRSFYDALLRSSAWRGLTAVANKRVYLGPTDPFGWIDDPASVNRIIGLPWLSSLCYPAVYQEDLRAAVRDFYDKFYRVKLTDRQLEALVRPAEAQGGGTPTPINVPLLGAEPVPFPTPNAPPSGMRPPGRGGYPGLAPNPPSATPGIPP